MGMNAECHPPDDFLVRTGWIGQGLPIVHCEVDPGQFSDGLYERYGIFLPPGVAAATRKRRLDFLAGRLAARQSLRAHGREDWQLGIRPGRDPDWPPGITGSLSHCQNNALAVSATTSRVRGMGVDIEALAGTQALEAIRKTVATKAEFCCLRDEGAIRDPLIAATLLFSAKESLFKSVHPLTGEIFGFGAVQTIRCHSGHRLLVLEFKKSIGGLFHPGDFVEVRWHRLGDFIITVCELPQLSG